MALLSPLRYQLQNAWNNLPWNREQLVREVAQCYADRLPQNIRVSWIRDGRQIVGTIFFSDEDFVMTAGETAEEFVEMVNDAIYASCEIPPQYIPALGGKMRIHPPRSEMEKLRDAAVKNSNFNFSSAQQLVAA